MSTRQANKSIFSLFVIIFSAWVGILCGAPVSISEAEIVAGDETAYVKTGPDLKVNGSDGPVTLPYGSRVIITAHVNPESSEVGLMRDWWVVKHAPDGWYYMWGTGFWDYIPDLSYIEPTTQAGLGFIPSYTLFDSATLYDLSKGTYTYYFGVDFCDGYLTDDDLEYDSVTITIY